MQPYLSTQGWPTRESAEDAAQGLRIQHLIAFSGLKGTTLVPQERCESSLMLLAAPAASQAGIPRSAPFYGAYDTVDHPIKWLNGAATPAIDPTTGECCWINKYEHPPKRCTTAADVGKTMYKIDWGQSVFRADGTEEMTSVTERVDGSEFEEAPSEKYDYWDNPACSGEPIFRRASGNRGGAAD